MNLKSTLLLGTLSVSLFGASLLVDAQKAGLKPIPNETQDLLKLIDNPKNPITPKKLELGRKLFFDPRLSKSGWISCNSCHNLSEGGDDGLSAAVGHKWTQNPHHLNSPTVYNAVFASSQFWDGRDLTLEAQAQGPIQAAPEMAATKEHVVSVITSIPEYASEYKGVYGAGTKVTFEKITDAIAAFERTLVTPSAYDDFLNGDDEALTKAQKDGLKTFIDKGCATCHGGVALGGDMNAFNITGTYKHQKVGDFKGDKNKMVKVPTLRNITQTAPYFHNGQIWELKEAIVEMGRIQLGIAINDQEAASIEEFLKSLEGRKQPMSVPHLPASTAKTPKPNLK